MAVIFLKFRQANKQSKSHSLDGVATSPFSNSFIISDAASEWITDSNCSVQSVPAYAISTPSPPGCSSMNSVTSYTLPLITSQQSASVLCFATSDIGIVFGIVAVVCPWSFKRCQSKGGMVVTCLELCASF